MYRPIPIVMPGARTRVVPDDDTASNIAETQRKDVNEWLRFGMRLGVSAALHPFDYAKVLMQLGYEPLPPRPGHSFFGKPVMYFPNIFEYVGYIRKMNGFNGLYRGLTPKLIGTVVSMLVSERLTTSLGLLPIDEEKEKDAEISDVELYFQFKSNLKRDIVITVSGVACAHPFHVISVRMMAQFIGGESIYKNLITSIKEIYQSEGVSGFFAGVVPKLICEVACVVLTSSVVYLVNKYLIKDKFGRQYNANLTQYFMSSLLYPLQVISTCMTVSGSRLMAGRPPLMPIYGNWSDCWNDLQARGELKRGGSLFWRTVFITPQATVGPPMLPKIKLFSS